MASVSRKHRRFSERNNNPVRVPGTKHRPSKDGHPDCEAKTAHAPHLLVSADQALHASGVVLEALSTAHS